MPTDQPAIPLAEFDQEMATTRKLLERVPTERGRWKPHEKSFALGNLAQLVSWMPGWIANTLSQPHIDLATAGGYSFEPTETLLGVFDQNVKQAREKLAAALRSSHPKSNRWPCRPPRRRSKSPARSRRCRIRRR